MFRMFVIQNVFFFCFSMFGDAREMELHYFLADDTVEICERIPNNSGRDAVPMFLRRQPLPKVHFFQCHVSLRIFKTILINLVNHSTIVSYTIQVNLCLYMQ